MHYNFLPLLSSVFSGTVTAAAVAGGSTVRCSLAATVLTACDLPTDLLSNDLFLWEFVDSAETMYEF